MNNFLSVKRARELVIALVLTGTGLWGSFEGDNLFTLVIDVIITTTGLVALLWLIWWIAYGWKSDIQQNIS